MNPCGLLPPTTQGRAHAVVSLHPDGLVGGPFGNIQILELVFVVHVANATELPLGRGIAREEARTGEFENGSRPLGDMHPQTCRTRWVLALMYQKQQRYAEAEPLLLKAWQGYAQALGSEHRDTLGVVGSLVSLYEAWGKPGTAAEWRKKLPPSKNAESGR